jgi:hypothetical protein
MQQRKISLKSLIIFKNKIKNMDPSKIFLQVMYLLLMVVAATLLFYFFVKLHKKILNIPSKSLICGRVKPWLRFALGSTIILFLYSVGYMISKKYYCEANACLLDEQYRDILITQLLFGVTIANLLVQTLIAVLVKSFIKTKKHILVITAIFFGFALIGAALFGYKVIDLDYKINHDTNIFFEATNSGNTSLCDNVLRSSPSECIEAVAVADSYNKLYCDGLDREECFNALCDEVGLADNAVNPCIQALTEKDQSYCKVYYDVGQNSYYCPGEEK